MRLKIDVAFLLKSFRELSREEQIVFASHLATALFCFFPWAYIEPYDYSESPYWISAFGGHTLAIGIVVFLISLGVCAIFLDKIFDKRRIHLPVSQNYVFLAAGIESLFLLFLVFSVWALSQKDIGQVEMRFGIFFCILMQIVALVSTFLKLQSDTKSSARHFFRSVEDRSIERPSAPTPSSRENLLKSDTSSKNISSQTSLLDHGRHND